MKKKLCKSRENKVIAGVCAGIAEYFGIDPTIVRLITAVVFLLKGAGLFLYIIACILMPYDDSVVGDSDIDNLKSANLNSEDGSSDKKNMNGKKHSDEEFDSFFNK